MLDLLERSGASCLILHQDEVIFSSSFIGVKPLLQFMAEAQPLPGNDLVLIDKVIGKAALLLAKRLGIRTIYTPVASEAALSSAAHHGIDLQAASVVPFITNRALTGMCPLEASVLDTNDPLQGEVNIRAAIRILMAGQN